MQTLNNNCARGLILWISGWNAKKCQPYPASCLLRQFLKATYLDIPTLLSFLIEQQPGQCHVRCFFRKHKGTNLSDKVLYSRTAIGKSHYCCCSLAYLSWTSKEEKHSMCPCYLLAHMSLSISLPTRQKLTQQSKKFTRICRRIEASYVLLSFMYWRDFRKAT